MTYLIVLVIVVAVPLLFYGIIYNALVGKKNQIENVFASLDALLKKRYDLVPNLVSSVQQYMEHEAGTLSRITELRAKATSGTLSDNEKVAVDNEMRKLVGGVMVAVENYPDLKASDNFLQLQRSLNELEEQISAGRRAYNSSVTDYNNALEMFPSNIVAGLHGYQKKDWFEIAEEQRESVDVAQMFNR